MRTEHYTRDSTAYRKLGPASIIFQIMLLALSVCCALHCTCTERSTIRADARLEPVASAFAMAWCSRLVGLALYYLLVDRGLPISSAAAAGARIHTSSRQVESSSRQATGEPAAPAAVGPASAAASRADRMPVSRLPRDRRQASARRRKRRAAAAAADEDDGDTPIDEAEAESDDEADAREDDSGDESDAFDADGSPPESSDSEREPRLESADRLSISGRDSSCVLLFLSVIFWPQDRDSVLLSSLR